MTGNSRLLLREKMVRRTMPARALWLSLLFICVVFLFSCSSKAKYAGTYRTIETDEGLRSELELKENGEGTWRVGDNEEPFSWYPKGAEIRLNTKKGGVIVAKIEGDSLHITLSGGKTLIFKKAE